MPNRRVKFRVEALLRNAAVDSFEGSHSPDPFHADEFVPLWSARQDKLSRPCAPLSADKSTKRISQAKVRDRQD
jgi:Txe/YoeB family toxin of Txe-Axe toxin-antitoxin module